MTDYESLPLADKWNRRFLEDSRFHNAPVRRLVVDYSHLLPKLGTALEIAGGTGFTTNFLQKSGLQVLELDISLQALLYAREKNRNAQYVTANALFLPFANICFDVICNFYFLERQLFGQIKNLLAPGGILFFETMLMEMQSIRPEIPMDHLLVPGELKSEFQSWEIIYSFDGWLDSDHGHKKAVAQLVARKPLSAI